MKLKRFVAVLAFLSILLFWYVHKDPVIAVRTEVFSSGFFDVGMNSKVEKISDDLFVISPAPIEEETLAELKTYRVKKYGILYFAEYDGEV
ncbi:hypothetical protein [Candidatus Enterococcus clewellii]|uniref:Uncharacterized protein n=1 Tax=Candidatus Enterococcus clewellii TaxID=1834193 RepID=A0AAQ3Y041_9ENTE